MISPARSIAFNVLLRVESGGYASDLLLAESAQLQSRDAGLASEIVFGSLRYQAQLDHLIQLYSGRKAAALDPEVRIALVRPPLLISHSERSSYFPLQPMGSAFSASLNCVTENTAIPVLPDAKGTSIVKIEVCSSLSNSLFIMLTRKTREFLAGKPESE